MASIASQKNIYRLCRNVPMAFENTVGCYDNIYYIRCWMISHCGFTWLFFLVTCSILSISLLTICMLFEEYIINLLPIFIQ